MMNIKHYCGLNDCGVKADMYRNIVDEEGIFYCRLDLKPHLNLDFDTLRGIEINVRIVVDAIGEDGKGELKSFYFTFNGITYEVRNRMVYLQGHKMERKAYLNLCGDLLRHTGYMKGLREEETESHDIVRYTGTPGVFAVDRPAMPEGVILKEGD